MEETIYQADLDKVIVLLKAILVKQASGDAMSWLENKQKQIFADKSDSIFFMTFSALSSYFGKDLIEQTQQTIQQADEIRKQWTLNKWSLVQAARAYLVLNYARHHLTAFKNAMDKMFAAADLQELIALYQSLPLFPYPEKFLLHATNGIRSNMLSVFDAIALNNPYPADYFDEIAWNQLVLKALFIESAVEQIIGLKRRANPALSKALLNTARERAAAKRAIKPELWCLLGLSTNKSTWPLLKGLFEEENAILRHGALLAFDHCELPEAKKMLDEHRKQDKAIQAELEKLRTFKEQCRE